jgi:CRISPR-associated protein Csd1
MLLQRLVVLSETLESAVPAFYKTTPVRWQLNLTATGQLADPQLVDLADLSDKKRKHGILRAVPYVTKTSGDAPAVGTDTGEYLLGWYATDSEEDQVTKRKARAEKRLLISRAQHLQWSQSVNDPRASAVVSFLSGGDVHAVARPCDWEPHQLIQLAVSGVPVADLPTTRTFWAGEAARRKTAGDHTAGICLVCGQARPLSKTLPQQLPQGLVPLAAMQGAALVSANKSIHTYDHTANLSSTIPICIECGRRAVEALIHVLADERSHLRFGDSRLAWWTVDADPVDLVDTLAVHDPESVASLVDRVRRTATAPTTGLEPARFCALTLAGNRSRVMIRDWVDMPLSALEHNVAAWFIDHRIANPQGKSGYQPLWLLALATGRSIKGKDGHHEYARLDAKGAQRPDDVGRALLRAALLAKPLPASLLAHLVTRIRTDGHLDDPRAALLRLALTRTPHPTKETPMPGLDPANRDPAYLAGRIFAALENLQDATSGRDASVNATFVDRYFAGAVANPRIALVQGRQLAAAWLKKLRRTNGGLAAVLDRQLTDLFDLLDATGGIPGRIGIADQATFLLGYHHQRANTLRRRIAAADARKITTAVSPSEATDPDTVLHADPLVTEGTLS